MLPPTAFGWHRSQSVTRLSVSQTCRIWPDKLLPVGCKLQLNTAQKCIKQVRPAKSLRIQPLLKHRIYKFYRHPCRSSLQPYLISRHPGGGFFLFTTYSLCVNGQSKIEFGPVNGCWPWVMALAGACVRLTLASMEHDVKRSIYLFNELLPVCIYRSLKKLQKMPIPTDLGQIFVAVFAAPNQLVDFSRFFKNHFPVIGNMNRNTVVKKKETKTAHTVKW